jgi:hypothetical protein
MCVCVCVYYCSTYYKAVRVGGRDSGGHVLRETTSRGLSGLVCPSRTSERGGEGHCVKEGGGGDGVTLALRFGCFSTLPHNVGIRKAQRRIHGDARRWGRRSSSRFSLLTPTRVTSVFVTGRSRSGQ